MARPSITAPIEVDLNAEGVGATISENGPAQTYWEVDDPLKSPFVDEAAIQAECTVLGFKLSGWCLMMLTELIRTLGLKPAYVCSNSMSLSESVLTIDSFVYGVATLKGNGLVCLS
jgi:hypothetical protein